MAVHSKYILWVCVIMWFVQNDNLASDVFVYSYHSCALERWTTSYQISLWTLISCLVICWIPPNLLDHLMVRISCENTNEFVQTCVKHACFCIAQITSMWLYVEAICEQSVTPFITPKTRCCSDNTSSVIMDSTRLYTHYTSCHNHSSQIFHKIQSFLLTMWFLEQQYSVFLDISSHKT